MKNNQKLLAEKNLIENNISWTKLKGLIVILKQTVFNLGKVIYYCNNVTNQNYTFLKIK